MFTEKNVIVSVQCPNCMKTFDTELVKNSKDETDCVFCGTNFNMRNHIYKAKMTIVIERTFKPI